MYVEYIGYIIIRITLPAQLFYFAVSSLQFSSEELLMSTDNFNDMNLIGKGGFGRVYRARDLRGRGTDAAIKVLNKVSILCVIMNVIFCWLFNY